MTDAKAEKLAALLRRRGSVTIAAYTTQYSVRQRPQIIVRSKEFETVDSIKKDFGGSVRKVNYPHGQTGWEWAVTFTKAVRVAKRVVPFGGFDADRQGVLERMTTLPENPHGRPRGQFAANGTFKER